MKLKAIIATIFLSLSFSSLAQSEDNIEISVDYVEGTCSEYFAMLQFEFRNNTNKWFELNDVTIGFQSDELNSTVSLVAGRALSAWHSAFQLERERSNIKTSLFLGALGVLGSAAMQSNNSNINALGKLSVISAAGGITIKGINKIIADFDGSIFPTNHILNSNILVPPGFSITKWVLLNTENNSAEEYVSSIELMYSLNDRKENRKFNIRRGEDRQVRNCKWQNSIKPASSSSNPYGRFRR